MILISCTTTQERVDKLFYTIESLKYQNKKPDKIIVNLSKEPYLKDSGIEKIPVWLSENAKVVVNFVKNTGPYRKLLPVFDMANDDDMIITIDDDVIYHEEWLNKLVTAGEKKRNAIVCGKARVMKKNFFGKWQSYSRWNQLETMEEGHNILPIGCAGILYRKNLIDKEFINNKKFLLLAPTCDDLWFRMASIRMGIEVFADPAIDIGNIYMQHDEGLDVINLNKPARGFFNRLYHAFAREYLAYFGFYHSQNDVAWRAINKNFRTALRKF